VFFAYFKGRIEEYKVKGLKVLKNRGKGKIKSKKVGK